MSTSAVSCEELVPQLGGRTKMMFMQANRIMSQCKLKILSKILTLYKFTALKLFVTPFFNGWLVLFLDYYILLCDVQIGLQAWVTLLLLWTPYTNELNIF